MINEINVPTEIHLAGLAALRDQHTAARDTEITNVLQEIILDFDLLKDLNTELRALLDRNVDEFISAGTRATIRATEKSIENAQHKYIKLTKDV